MMKSKRDSWRGRLFLSGGHGLFFGPVARTRMHAHRAVQVCFALEGTFGLRTRVGGEWRSYRAVTIASGQPHEIDGHGNTLAVLYLDPEAVKNRSFARISHDSGVCPVPAYLLKQAMPILLRAQRTEDTAERIPVLCHRLGEMLAPGSAPWGIVDPRVRQTMHLMTRAAGKPANLVELSTAIAISPARLSRLFREHTGLPIGQYVLWLRLGEALRKLTQGRSGPEVAEATGFSDSAHLSRTLRRMFGISPSEIRARRNRAAPK